MGSCGKGQPSASVTYVWSQQRTFSLVRGLHDVKMGLKLDEYVTEGEYFRSRSVNEILIFIFAEPGLLDVNITCIIWLRAPESVWEIVV